MAMQATTHVSPQPKTPFRRKSELMMTSPKFITEINFKHLGQPITL